jgi:hypothetical protein
MVSITVNLCVLTNHSLEIAGTSTWAQASAIEVKRYATAAVSAQSLDFQLDDINASSMVRQREKMSLRFPYALEQISLTPFKQNNEPVPILTKKKKMNLTPFSGGNHMRLIPSVPFGCCPAKGTGNQPVLIPSVPLSSEETRD